MEREILAAAMAAISDIDLTTNDRIEACATGHGSLNVALCCVANVVAEEIQRGADISLRFTNTRSLPLDDVLAKAIGAARLALLNCEIAEDSTDDCCDHLTKGKESLALAREYGTAMAGFLGAWL